MKTAFIFLLFLCSQMLCGYQHARAVVPSRNTAVAFVHKATKISIITGSHYDHVLDEIETSAPEDNHLFAVDDDDDEIIRKQLITAKFLAAYHISQIFAHQTSDAKVVFAVCDEPNISARKYILQRVLRI